MKDRIEKSFVSIGVLTLLLFCNCTAERKFDRNGLSAVDYCIENDAIKRVVSVNTTVRTTSLSNKLTGQTYTVTSDEFKIILNHRTGPILTAGDFVLDGSVSVLNGGKKLIVPLKNKAHKLKVKVVYEADGSFYMHKWLEINAISGRRTVSIVEVERMKINGAKQSRPNGRGTTRIDPRFPKGDPNDGPVYADNFWMGIEFPKFYNDFDGDVIRLYHYPNKIVSARETLKTYKVVLGAAGNEWSGNARLNPIKESFFKYIRQWRSTPIRPYRTYNNWYVCKPEENAILNVINSEVAPLYDAGLVFDSFTVDMGWANSPALTNGWYPDSSRWPNGFGKVQAELAKYGATLDLWMPIANWAPVPIGSAAHKYMKERFTHFVREGVTGFKMDFARFTQLGYKGIDEYQLEASNEGILDIVRACREINPDVVFYLTSFVSRSPWWLGEIDYIYENAMDLTGYRDVWHYTNCLKMHVPQNSWMQVGLPGPHARDYDFDNPGNCWNSREQLISNDRYSPVDFVFRGPMFFEVYASFRGTAVQAIADLAEFHKNNFDILTKQPYVSGCSDMYYWAYFDEEKGGLIKFRNKSSSSQTLTIKLNDTIRITKNPGIGFELRQVNISPYSETQYAHGMFYYGDTFNVTMPVTTKPLIIRLKPACGNCPGR